MRIGIDCRMCQETGVGRYIRNLINHLQVLDIQNEYFLFLLKKDFDQFKYSPNFHQILADFSWYGLIEQVKFPQLLKKHNLDLVHFPHFNVPIFYRGKFVVTIHDLIHQHFRTRETTTHNPFFHMAKKIGYKQVFNYAVNKSTKVITPSHFVEKQLIKEHGLDKSKIMVTYEAAEESIISLSKQNQSKTFQDLTKNFDFKKPYLFYIGNAQPHKNLLRLISVFEILKTKYPDVSLVLSGPDHYFWEKIKKRSHTRGVTFTGFVSEKEMVTLYKNAQVFVMPSLEEGFGIPILEAMACSCPVVSSSTASLPEVGGEAAIYFNSEDEEDMINKISQVLDNEKLRKELVRKGKGRYKQFSWEKMTRQTLEIYQKTI